MEPLKIIMKNSRYVAAAVLLAIILWYDIAMKGQGLAESAVPFVSLLGVIFLGRILVRRVPGQAKVVLWIGALVVCSAINLLQLYIHAEWFKQFGFGVTIGTLVVMFTDSDKKSESRKMR